MLDAEKIREALARLTPEERADLEEKIMRWYAETGTWIESTATAHGRTFPVYSEVITVPTPPGYAGPSVIRLKGLGATDDEDAG